MNWTGEVGGFEFAFLYFIICESNIFFYISSIICILSPIVKAVAVELGFKEDLVASLPFTLLHLLEQTDFQHS